MTGPISLSLLVISTYCVSFYHLVCRYYLLIVYVTNSVSAGSEAKKHSILPKDLYKFPCRAENLNLCDLTDSSDFYTRSFALSSLPVSSFPPLLRGFMLKLFYRDCENRRDCRHALIAIIIYGDTRNFARKKLHVTPLFTTLARGKVCLFPFSLKLSR